MHLVARYGHEAVVQMLVKAGADVKAVNKGGQRPADVTSKAAVKKLLEAKG